MRRNESRVAQNGMKLCSRNLHMAQLMGNCKSCTQAVILTDRTASVGVTDGPQLSQTYEMGVRTARIDFKKRLWLVLETRCTPFSHRGLVQRTHLRCRTCHELCRCPVWKQSSVNAFTHQKARSNAHKYLRGFQTPQHTHVHVRVVTANWQRNGFNTEMSGEHWFKG